MSDSTWPWVTPLSPLGDEEITGWLLHSVLIGSLGEDQRDQGEQGPRCQQHFVSASGLEITNGRVRLTDRCFTED